MNKKKVMLAAIVLALVLSIGGVLAYFSDSDTATNTFTVGKISIQLTEEHWVANNAQNILPNQKIAKDPKITNNGNNAAYVFMEVSIPMKDVSEIVIEEQSGADPATTPTDPQDLFKMLKTDGSDGPNSGWVLISTTADTTNNVRKYVYAYASGTAAGNMTSLAKNASTPTLFDQIQFLNVQEGWGLEESTSDVVVTGYAIQTENLNGIASPTPAQVWAVLSANEVNEP